jgi:hypothetical protein
MKLQRPRIVGSVLLVLFVLIFLFVRARHLLFR